MKYIRIGIRELKVNASEVIRRVEAGESVEVHRRGRPVARISPWHPGSLLERMVAEGLADPPRRPGDPRDILDVEPLGLPEGSPSVDEILDELRAEQ